MLILALTSLFSMLPCHSALIESTQHLLGDHPALLDIRTLSLYKSCDNKTIQHLLCVNNVIRDDLHGYLFHQRKNTFPTCDKKIDNILLNRYFIISLHVLYGEHASNKEKKIFSKDEENRYLRTLAKTTDTYKNVQRQNWLPIKSLIFENIISQHDNIALQNLSVIFSLPCIVGEDMTLVITPLEQEYLKKHRIYNYFLTFYIKIKKVKKIELHSCYTTNNMGFYRTRTKSLICSSEKINRHTDDNWSWYVPLHLGYYGVSAYN